MLLSRVSPKGPNVRSSCVFVVPQTVRGVSDVRVKMINGKYLGVLLGIQKVKQLKNNAQKIPRITMTMETTWKMQGGMARRRHAIRENIKENKWKYTPQARKKWKMAGAAGAKKKGLHGVPPTKNMCFYLDCICIC